MPWKADELHAGFTTGGPWLPVYGRHLPLAVDRQSTDPDSMLAFSRALLRWRRTQPLLRTGSIAFIDAPEPVLWFERREGNQSLQAVFNLGGESVSIALREALEPLAGHPLSSSSSLQADGERRMLKLAPYGVFFGRPAGEEEQM